MLRKILRKLLRHDNAVSRFTLQLLREYRLRKFQSGDDKVLEISGGSLPLSRDYLNVDISNEPEVDLVTDLREPIPFADASTDKIVSVATLEHFSVTDVRRLLVEFFRLLKPGGVLEIGVPSLEKIFNQYRQTGCDDVVLRYLHGGLKDKYDVHLFVVDAKRFIQELKAAGFSEAREVEYDFPRHSADFMMKIVARK